MNYPGLYSIGLSILLCCSICQAQEDRVQLREPEQNKPALFAGLPEKIPVDINDLEKLFSPAAAKGDESTLRFLDKKITGFNGKIISATSKYNNSLRSVVVNSTRFNGATLTFSSSTATDGTTRYSGRIVSFNHDDLYVLEKENDSYFLVKKKFHELISE